MILSEEISAIVTGGASGLGAAAARQLADAGVSVALFDLNVEEGGKSAAEINGLFCQCNVTDEQSVAAALAKARDANGQERILVNCAGITIGEKTARRDRETGQVAAHSLKNFAKVIEVNLIGTFNMIRLSAAGMMNAAPVTEDGGRGVIINTASVAAEDGQVGQVAYAASKGGVAAMTLPIARDLARDGIRVVTIMPGLFETPMFAGLTDDVRDALARQVPFPSRLGNPDEYGALARHICENDMLNGVSIRLDGAVRLAPR